MSTITTSMTFYIKETHFHKHEPSAPPGYAYACSCATKNIFIHSNHSAL